MIPAMGTAISFLIFFVALVATFLWGAPTFWAILAALVAFFISSLLKGYSFKNVFLMGWKEMPKAFIVIRVIFFVGILTGILRSSGTIAYFVYAGTKFMPPVLFVLLAFLICVILSYLLGSSFAVCSTAGVILMVLARSGGVCVPVVAGAIVSGVYFGDRGAPTSSCASLVAALTETKVTDNVKWMHRTALLPYLVVIALYTFLSFRHPLAAIDEGVMRALEESFHLSPLTLLPALVILVLPFLKKPIWLTMALSSLVGGLITICYQGYSFFETLTFAVVGFTTTSSLSSLGGGGIVSMKTVLILIPAASMLSAILGGTGVLEGAQKQVDKMAERIGRLPSMFLLSTFSAMIFCNQTVSVMLSHQMLKGAYEKENAEKTEMAIDIENTGVTLSGLVPWSIACSVPLSILGADMRALPYEFLLYLIPLMYLGLKRFYFPNMTH